MLSSEDNRLEYELVVSKILISGVLSELGAIDGIQDAEIKKASIEDVIAGLYIKWKKSVFLE